MSETSNAEPTNGAIAMSSVTERATGHPSVGPGKPFVDVRSVSKTFKRKGASSDSALKALEDVSLGIDRGEFTSIIGPSGCGKTTLLRLIAGLDRPDTGEILVGGRRVERPSPERAVVFQQPALLPWATVIENVSLGLRVRGVGKEERTAKAAAILETVGLAGYGNHIPRELSGGMQQRVALARVFVLSPSVLLMDEPFASLDEITRRRLHRQLLRLWDREPRTGVFITHNVEEAIILADHVVIMSPHPGRVSEIFEVPLPRPRRLEQEHSPEFLEAREYIWKRIEEWDS
jgi:NitT/TauT family transport system ATP-binding protein